MKDKAIVQDIHGEQITLICGAAEGCRSCNASSFCAAKTREVDAVNHMGLSLMRGDQVEYYIPPGWTILAGFVVLIIPLLTFIGAFVLSGRFIPGLGEGLQALFGLAGLAGGFGLSFLYNRIMRNKNVPEIIRRIEQGRQEEQDSDEEGRAFLE